MISRDIIGKTVYDEVIVGVIWGIGAVLVGIFGGAMIECGGDRL
jgi:hypothetical protein